MQGYIPIPNAQPWKKSKLRKTRFGLFLCLEGRLITRHNIPTTTDTAVREAKEEFNIKAVFLHNNQKPFFITRTQTVGLTPGHTDVSLWYLLKGNIHDTPRFDRSEFTDVEWYTFTEILETDPVIFDPHLQRFAAKLFAYLAN